MPPTHRSSSTAPRDEVGRVVLRAMEMVVEPVVAAPKKPMAHPQHVDRMARAVLGAEPQLLRGVVDEMRAENFTALEIAEVYVPAVAQFLGQGWVCDELDFAAVTIGAARLQSMLRYLEFESSYATPRAVGFLVGVPEGVQHTLGASVLAAQLRQRGYSVHLDLTLTPERLAEQMRKEHYGGILLSASGAAHLESCRKLLDHLRQESRNTPVILGGTLLEQVNDIKSLTGVDLVTSDVGEALAFCGEPAKTHASKPVSENEGQGAGV